MRSLGRSCAWSSAQVHRAQTGHSWGVHALTSQDTSSQGTGRIPFPLASITPAFCEPLACRTTKTSVQPRASNLRHTDSDTRPEVRSVKDRQQRSLEARKRQIPVRREAALGRHSAQGRRKRQERRPSTDRTREPPTLQHHREQEGVAKETQIRSSEGGARANPPSSTACPCQRGSVRR